MKKMMVMSIILLAFMLTLVGCGANGEKSTELPPVNEGISVENENVSEVVEEVIEEIIEEDNSYLLIENAEFKHYTITESDVDTSELNLLSVTNPNWGVGDKSDKIANIVGDLGLNTVFENDIVKIATVAGNMVDTYIPVLVTNKTNHSIIISSIDFSWQEDSCLINDIPCGFSAYIEVPANETVNDEIFYESNVIVLNNISMLQSFKVNLEIAYDDDTVGEPVETGLFEIRTKNYGKMTDEVKYTGKKIETKTEGLTIYDAGWVGYNTKHDNMADKVLVVENNTDYNISVLYSSYRIEEVATEKNNDLYYRPIGDYYFLPKTAGAVGFTYCNGTSSHDIYPNDNLVVCDLVLEVVVRDSEGEVIDSYEIIYEDSLDWNKVEIGY